MRPKTPLVLALAACGLMLGGCALGGGGYKGPPRAPEPVKPVDAARLFSGRWAEIARLPVKITDGCVAGYSFYALVSETKVRQLDGCFMGSPAGKEKTIGGPARILDPGRNTKLEVDYRYKGVIRIKRSYWFLDHADDYSWFISADPAFDKLWIFTRNPQITAAERAVLVERAKGFGYDVTRLEFPEQPAR